LIAVLARRNASAVSLHFTAAILHVFMWSRHNRAIIDDQAPAPRMARILQLLTQALPRRKKESTA